MRRGLLTSLLLIPVFAFAASIQAGFPAQSIWLSKSAPVEGEIIVVSAVVVNGSTAELRGTLAFVANDSRIGAREFELPTSASQIHSIEWKPKRGEYKLLARIEGTSTELSQRETPSITVTVKEPPAPPSEIERTISQVVQTGSTIASSSAPVIVQTAQNIFAQTEALRNAGIEHLEKYLASQAPSRYLGSRLTNGIGTVAGTSTGSTNSLQASNAAGFDASAGKGRGVLSNIAQTAAAAALFTLKNVALFYPIPAFLILGILYLLARRIRRNRE